MGEGNAAGIRCVSRIERAARTSVVANRAIREARDETAIRRDRDLSVVGQQTQRRDMGDCDEAAILAEQQVLAVRRIGDAAIAAARVPKRRIVLQYLSSLGVEYFDGGLTRTQSKYRGG